MGLFLWVNSGIFLYMSLEAFSDLDIAKVKSAAVDFLNNSLRENSQKPMLFLSSGGSAFDLLDEIEEEAFGSHITVGVLDERYSEDLYTNNFAQLRSMPFYQKAKDKGCRLISTLVEDRTQEQLADDFEQALKQWRKENLDGKIVITQGIGPDLHTSGVMPFPENQEVFENLFLNPEKWVVAYDASGKNPYSKRVTTTLSFLKDEVDISVVYAVGKDLTKVFEEEGSLHQTPARIIKEMKNVKVFSDKIYNV